jgi:hypothetical protein
VTVGRIDLAKGQIQVIGGALPTPSEDLDHRFGLRSYALTYSGLYLMENAVRYDAPGLGATAPRGFVSTVTPGRSPGSGSGGTGSLAATGGSTPLALAGLLALALALRLRHHKHIRAERVMSRDIPVNLSQDIPDSPFQGLGGFRRVLGRLSMSVADW